MKPQIFILLQHDQGGCSVLSWFVFWTCFHNWSDYNFGLFSYSDFKWRVAHGHFWSIYWTIYGRPSLDPLLDIYRLGKK